MKKNKNLIVLYLCNWYPLFCSNTEALEDMIIQITEIANHKFWYTKDLTRAAQSCNMNKNVRKM